MRRASLALAASTLLVLAACSDDSSIAPPLDEAVSTHPQLAPPTARSNGLPVLRNARRLRDLRKQLDKVLFNVEFRYIVPPSASVEAAFNQARRRWQKIIIKDVEPIEGLLPQGLCFGGLPDFEGTVDDVLIDVLLIPIDGPGQILGAAGPCFVRTSDDLTVTGVMIFDTDDLAFLEELELMDEVIVHEMGHVLGVGTLWDFNRTLLVGAGTGSPTYTGRLATAAYRVLGGRGVIPVEGDFGPGTADSHWDEDRFDNELMTGFINLGENPLSIITAASARDLGYGALPFGDPYDLPKLAAARVALAQATGEGIDIAKREQLIKPKAVVE